MYINIYNLQVGKLSSNQITTLKGYDMEPHPKLVVQL